MACAAALAAPAGTYPDSLLWAKLMMASFLSGTPGLAGSVGGRLSRFCAVATNVFACWARAVPLFGPERAPPPPLPLPLEEHAVAMSAASPTAATKAAVGTGRGLRLEPEL